MASGNKGAVKLQEFVAHSSNVSSLALGHKSGYVLATGGADKKVNLWAVGKNNCIMSLSGLSGVVTSVRFGCSEGQVVGGDEGGWVKVWDLEEARLRRSLPAHKAPVRDVDFHPFSQDMLTSASDDTSIKLWDLRRKGCVFTYRGGGGGVRSARFSPDGLWVAGSGAEGAGRVWDLRSGRLLKELSQGGGGPLQFHPHEFLLAIAAPSAVHYWDLEHFTPVSTSPQEPTHPPRCLMFSAGGEVLYVCSEGRLRAECWEPQRVVSTLPIPWGKVADLATTNSTLVGASVCGSSVSIWLCDSKKLLLPSGGGESDPAPFTPSNPLRKSFNKQKPNSEQVPPRVPVKTIEESERSETDPEDEILPVIPDVEDYRAVFRPNKTLRRSPTSTLPQSSDEDVSEMSRKVGEATLDSSDEEPQPWPVDEGVGQGRSKAPPEARTPPEITARGGSRRNSDSADHHPVRLSSTVQHSSSETHIAARKPSLPHPQPRMCELKILQPQPSHQNPPASTSMQNRVRQEEPAPPPDFIPMSMDRPAGLDLNNFVVETGANEMSEDEVLQFMMGDAVMTILEARIRNLNIVYNIWHSKDLKTSVQTAANLRDKSVIADFLGVITNRPGLWNLDICVVVLPAIHQLLQSKFESHMKAGVEALGLILRNFASVIRTNILSGAAPLGVDISREERYNKCRTCYNDLVSIRAFLLKRQTVQGSLGQSFRDLCASLHSIDS